MDKLKVKLLIIALLFTTANDIIARDNLKQKDVRAFFFDAVVFDSEEPGKARVDVYTIVPAKSLRFVKSGNIYGARYDMNIAVFNDDGSIVDSKHIKGGMKLDSYDKSQGGNAEFDYSQTIFELPVGTYKIKCEMSDLSAGKDYSRSRTISVLDFDVYDLSMSGILIVSSIEKKNDRYVITPHPNDNIGDLESGFFAFFEVYNRMQAENIEIKYQILNTDDMIIQEGESKPFNLEKGVNREFVRIENTNKLKMGAYTLQLTAYRRSDTLNPDSLIAAAVARRSIKVIRTVGLMVMNDLEKAIKQLRYVAYSDDIDFIEEAADIDEKQSRFESFWKKLDPSPGTEKNEAFEQFYSRIEYANNSFKAYTEGWMTDKGMVFVIFGKPLQSERYSGYGDGRTYEKWIYQQNREFIFVDNTGFGDFRLARPMTVTEKYKYQP